MCVKKCFPPEKSGVSKDVSMLCIPSVALQQRALEADIFIRGKVESGRGSCGV
jgi:hypothetical protein